MDGDHEPGAATADTHPAGASLRARIERFARLRAAHRALPVCAECLEGAEARENRADALRQDLGRLTALGDSPEALESSWTRGAASIDACLDEMESDLLARVDRLDFPTLRAHLPRAVETHRREGIALLDVVLGERQGLPRRLGKVEYLVTLLSTEQRDGRRQIVHDPVALTPGIGQLAQESSTLRDAREIAVEIHQAASLDFDATSPIRSLARIRARKEALGIGLFSPEVLRAVVTYNARMFNWILSASDVSRASDAEIREVLDELYPAESMPPHPASPIGSHPLDDASAVAEAGALAGGASVLGSAEVGEILAALRRRLRGERIGACGVERIALALDESRLDALEREAILADSPSRLHAVVARVAVVGLMLRDRGAIQPELLDLGITQTELANQWVVELERALGSLVAELIAEGGQYKLAGELSGIKTKHLLAARSAVRLEQGPAAGGAPACDPSEAAGAEARPGRGAAARRAGGKSQRGLAGGDCEPRSWPWAAVAREVRGRPALAFALVTIAIVAGIAVARAPSGAVATLRARELSRISPHVASAYRSDAGRGGLLIGRLDASFEKLDADARAEALAEMKSQLRREGLREAMLYDEKGALRVHIANGTIRRPLPASDAAAARRPATTGA